MLFTISSPVFTNNGDIPSRYTCDGENILPPLALSGVPEGTRSIVIVMDDADIPEFVKDSLGIEKFDHLVLYNIAPDVTTIEEGEMPGQSGLNSKNKHGYAGPCPPDREHRYIFRAFALDDTLTFLKTPTLQEVEAALEELCLDSATLVGRYERKRKMHLTSVV